VSAGGPLPAFALLGFGELAGALAQRLAEAGAEPPRVFTRARRDPGRAAAMAERLAAAPVAPAATLDAAVAAADVVLACVPAGAALDVAARAAVALRRDGLYVDLTSARPEDKAAAGEAVTAAGGAYVDAAVLGAVAASGADVPILAAGPGAVRLGGLASRVGWAVTVIEAPPGAAARVKLLRSVYMKGRDALIVEMMLAARRHGVEDALAASIAGPGEEVAFPALADRVLGSLAMHAGRRADELESSVRLLEAGGVQPLVSRGAVARLRRVADSGVRERLGGVRPAAGAQVLDELERVPER
jgi:3-hydroxyisobutyrate dehydrogenase-like beta-hydroxyacid dehydrogenase